MPPENVTLCFCKNFAVIQSHYACKICSTVTIPELNWNQRFWDNRTKLNICHHMLTLSTQLQNRSFHVIERTRKSSKCQEMKNTRAKRVKPLFFIVTYANLWRSCCHRRRGCLSSLLIIIYHIYLCMDLLRPRSYPHNRTFTNSWVMTTESKDFYLNWNNNDYCDNFCENLKLLDKLKPSLLWCFFCLTHDTNYSNEIRSQVWTSVTEPLYQQSYTGKSGDPWK